MKTKNSKNSIYCSSDRGPSFRDDSVCGTDLCIVNNCNINTDSYIENDGTLGYKCDAERKAGLFDNTMKKGGRYNFRVDDYEVFGLDYTNRELINELCKYRNIIEEYISTSHISEESLKTVENEDELIKDLNAIRCDDVAIRLKISNYFFKNRSEMLTETQLINKQYDEYFREWIGDYQWKLIYRASEHGYTAKSFHEHCDNVRGPTLVVIKSTNGWIFGGFTTQSWKYNANDKNCITMSLSLFL